jgi:hypothetical protein
MRSRPRARRSGWGRGRAALLKTTLAQRRPKDIGAKVRKLAFSSARGIQ